MKSKNIKSMFLVSALLCAVMVVPTFAAWQSLRISTFTASIQFTQTGSVSMTAELRNRSNNLSTTTITWSGITIGQTDWKAADQYILLHATITATAGLIQIYTDNKASDANPQYTGSGNPAGLVMQEDTTKTLKMCWRVTDVSTNTLSIVQGADNRLYSSELGGSYPCFLWFKDKNTPNIPDEGTTQFQNGEDYVTVVEAGRGWQHAEGTWASIMPSPNYIYIGAKFQNATTPATYKTTTLRLEAAIE